MTRTYVSIGLLMVTMLSGISARAQPDSLDKKISYSIKQSINFLNNRMPIKSHNLLLLVEYFERAYGLKDNLEAKKQLGTTPVFDDERREMKFFYPLYGRKSEITKLDIANLNGMLQLMAISINTNKYRPDKKYNDAIRAYSAEPGRDLAHAALCLAWIREAGLEAAITGYDSLYQLQVKNLQILAEREGAGDSGLEGLAGLIRLGKSAAIKKEWIINILNAQNKDGGWSMFPADGSLSNEHTTLLAIWVLSDYQNHGKTKCKWLAVNGD